MKREPWPLIRRFLNKFTIGDGCWEWTAGKNGAGYGVFYINRRHFGAHRAVYEFMRGPVPEGMDLDHLCRNPSCVRPDHLEPVTHRENILRGRAPAALHARKVQCPEGHPYDEANTYVTPSGSRNCRACRLTQNRQWRERQRG